MTIAGQLFTKQDLKKLIEEEPYRAECFILSLNDWDLILQINDWLGEYRRDGLNIDELQRRLTEKLMNS